MTWVLDLDGVIWLADDPIPGAADAVARLRAAGERVLFATNNSFATVGEYEARLVGVGIPANGGLVTSAMAGATLVEPGERVLVCGGPGVIEATQSRGADVMTAGEATRHRNASWDVVLAGFHRDFDYERLRVAAQAVTEGARLVATNDDATYPTPEGPIPGAGAIVAAISYATGVAPTIAGKPYAPMVSLIRSLAERDRPRSRSSGMVVGDRPETDGVLAASLGYRFGLVLSGVTSAADLPVEPHPDMVAADLARLVDAFLGGH